MDRSLQTRRPSHPGEILQNLYLDPLGLNSEEFAKKIAISPEVIESLIHERLSISIDLALRFAQAFNTTPELWLNLQRNLDLWQARQDNQEWRMIKPLIQQDNSSLPV